MARKNELYNYLGSGGRDPNRIFQLGGHEELNQIRQGESARITGEKTAGETLDAGLARHRKMLGEWVNNPEEARQWLATGFGDPATKKHYESSGSYGDLAKRIPTDPAAFADWKEKAVIGMDKFLTNREAKHFSDTGGQIIATDSQNRPIGAPMDKTLTPEQGLTAFPGLQEAQASRKQLVEDIKQGATNMQNTASSPELADVFKTQQAARYEELAKLDKGITGMQTQAAQGKHASAEFLQVNARLEQLRAAGQQDSPEGKALQARIAKETNIPQADESVVVRTTTDNDGTVHFYNRFGAELRSQPNAGKTAPDSLAGPEKRMPAHILETVAKNNAAVANIDNALKQVSLYPSGFGAQAYLPDAILQRTDPNGVTARATVANIGSLKIHDRSGAAVTVGETPRLRPFIPAVNDAPETVVKKLKELRREMLVMDKEYKKTLTEQGYRTGSPAEAGATRTGATVSNWN
jgi:hypothetical protein